MVKTNQKDEKMIYLDLETHRKLKILAANWGITMKETIKILIEKVEDSKK